MTSPRKPSATFWIAVTLVAVPRGVSKGPG
jgi:hypothetical protein